MSPQPRIRLTSLIGKALDAALRALRDLDADAVPASLRRVVGHSGDLTPPLADRLARELDSLPWLRERALEAWPEAEGTVDPADRASALFLLRPDGWMVEFTAAVAAAAADTAEVGRVERDREATERAMAEARRREKEARRRADEAESEVRRMRRSAAEPARSDRSSVARAREEMERRQARWEAERHALEADVASLERETAALRDDLRRSGRERADLARALEETRTRGRWVTADPVELAKLLDDVAAQARAATSPDEAEEAPVRARIGLPHGIRPDDPRAIDAMLAHPGPLQVVVDGYNAGMRLSAGDPAEVRTRLGALLERLVVVAPATHRVSVVWDSSQGQADTKRSGRLEERFAEAGASADDVVVAIAAGAEVPAVVVSNDREVRVRAEAAGAIALWSDALIGWGTERR